MSERADAQELRALATALRGHLARRRDFGLSRTEAPPASPVPGPELEVSGSASEQSVRTQERPSSPAQPASPARRPAAPAARPESPEVAEIRSRAAACADLGSLRELVSGCTACALARTRTQTVFADGTGTAGVMFIGEAPGQHEDEQGVPFVGRAGQLLTDIIEKGMGLSRSDVLIANVLKCRPPGNRDPEPGEKALCTGYLDRQIELVDPKVLITLGLHASQHVLSSTSSIGRLRGRVHRMGGRAVVATYHPAYLLRSPGMKKECWKDIQLAMKELGLPLPGS